MKARWPLYALFSLLLNGSCVDVVNHWSASSWEMTAEGCVVVVSCRGAPVGRAELSQVMPASAQHIPSLANPNVCFFMILRSDPTLGKLLFAKIYPKLQERQRANWLIYNKKLSQTEQNAPVIRTVHAFPLDTLYGRSSDRVRQVF